MAKVYLKANTQFVFSVLISALGKLFIPAVH